MQRFLFFGLVFFLALSFGSCKKKPKDGRWDDTLNSGIIKIACDEDFKNLMDAEIDAYQAFTDYSAIIYPIYTNENEVIRLLLEDSVRFALTTRGLNAAEKKAFTDKQMVVRKFIIAFDGIAVVSNKANPDSLISLSTIKKILTGEITEWSQINPQSSLGTIRVVFDNNKSGILRYVADSIMTKGESPSPNLYALGTGAELIQKVSEMPNAIGIVGFNVISDETFWKTQDRLRLMRIGKDEKVTLENTYLPYAGDIKNENYPLWRSIYILLSDPKSGVSSGFSIFLAHDVGQMVVLKSGLLPAVGDPQNRSVKRVDVFPGDNNKN